MLNSKSLVPPVEMCVFQVGEELQLCVAGRHLLGPHCDSISLKMAFGGSGRSSESCFHLHCQEVHTELTLS